MKKTYMNPTTSVVKVETLKMIASSLDYVGTTDATSGNLGRRGGNIWDDEEEY